MLYSVDNEVGCIFCEMRILCERKSRVIQKKFSIEKKHSVKSVTLINLTYIAKLVLHLAYLA